MLRRRLCPLLLVIVGAGGLAPRATGTSSGGFQLHGTVTYVVDGDTVQVQPAAARSGCG